MKTARRNQTYNVHSPLNKPQFIVASGEEFLAETELCTGSWLGSLHDTWAPEKTTAANPTVCVGVEGAMPGDVLAVRILDIQPDSIGYTGFEISSNPLAGRIAPEPWGLHTRTVAIEDGYVRWSDAVRLPVRPMIGTLGTAPELEALSNTRGGPHGGNMDVQEAEAGTIVYLPVFTEGALLHVGDVHALQGDGEINCGGGIECRSLVRLKADVIKKPAGMQWIRMESESHIMTVACCRSVDESFHTAAGEMIRWMTAEYGFTTESAYLLMGQVLEARCTQFVNPTSSYICKMPKRYLIP